MKPKRHTQSGWAYLESTTIWRLESRYLFSVAQIANLPYRRLQIGRALAVFRRPGQGAVLQDGILRYSRLAVCATNTTEALNRYESRQNPHAGKRALPSAASPGCGLAELSSSARGAPLRRSLVVVSRRCAQRRGQSAFLLEECLVYLVVSSILLGLAFAAFYRVLDNAKSVRRNAADISRVLQAGERWRTDIHQATGPLELVSLEGAIEQALHVPQRSGEVVYFFGETNVLRRAGPDAPWTEILAAVKRSRIIRDARDRVVAWRWEVELIPGRKEPLVRPLFTFQAAARNLEKP